MPHSLATIAGARVERLADVPSSTSQLHLQVAQLLCSKVCHDLAGPAGAVDAGIDLLTEVGADDAETTALLTLSARQLTARLAYYRIAFGFAGGRSGLSWADARRLAEEYFADGRVDLAWTDDGDDCGGGGSSPGDGVRLVLCALLIGAEGLPRGGRLSLTLDETARGWQVTVCAEGTGARLDQATVAALQTDDPSELTSRSVAAFYLAHIVDRLGGDLRIDFGTKDAIRVRATVPFASSAPVGTA